MSDLTVTRNETADRYEGRRGDDVAVIEYRTRDDDPSVVVMTHTEVPESLRGQGVAGQLVRQALDDVRTRDETVEAQCEYVAGWLEKHPQYQDLRATKST